jgi:4-coumarate--CoA ligase
LKEIIKVKGIGVAPAELEDLLLGHPKVEDTAVMDIEDEKAGERPKGDVVLKKGASKQAVATGRGLIEYVQ